MPPVGLFLAVGLTVGLAAQSCDLAGSGFTIDEVRDQITVTNSSPTQAADISVSVSLGEVSVHLEPGTSRTVGTLASGKYTLEVDAPGDPSGATYRQSLLDLRSTLQDLTLTPEAPPSTVAGAIAELAIVQGALGQLHQSTSFQSCSGPIKSGVTSEATLTWTPTGSNGAGIWSLNCG